MRSCGTAQRVGTQRTPLTEEADGSGAGSGQEGQTGDRDSSLVAAYIVVSGQEEPTTVCLMDLLCTKSPLLIRLFSVRQEIEESIR